jgi:hypothetical protein
MPKLNLTTKKTLQEKERIPAGHGSSAIHHNRYSASRLSM